MSGVERQTLGEVLADAGVTALGLNISRHSLVDPERADEHDLLVGLSRVMFPIVVLLALNGLVVGILNAHDHFSVPAIAPLVWNVAIIAGLVGLRGLFDGRETRSTPTRSASWSRRRSSWRWSSPSSNASASRCASPSTGATRAWGAC